MLSTVAAGHAAVNPADTRLIPLRRRSDTAEAHNWLERRNQ